MRRPPRHPRAFTLLEMLVTIGVIAIVAAMVVPTVADDRMPRLVATAWVLQSDVEFAQALTISRPDEPVVVRIAADGRAWWLAPDATRDDPILDDKGEAYLVACGVGRAQAARDVTIAGVDLENGTDLVFTELGGLADFTKTPALVLDDAGLAIALVVSPFTGAITLEDDPDAIAQLLAPDDAPVVEQKADVKSK